MSLNYIQPLEPYCSFDPRIDFDTNEEDEVLGSTLGEKGYGDKILVYKGPKNNEYFEIEPISGSSNANGSSDWSYFLPSRESVLDRTIMLKADITVDMKATTSTNNQIPFLYPNRFALQAFPLHHCIRTIQIQFDANLYTCDLTNSIEHMKYFSYTEDEIKTWSSLTPALLDNSFSYVSTSNNDVLTSRAQTGLSFVPSRGSFGFKSIKNVLGTANDPAQSTITYTVTECLNISPLILNAISQSGSTGLTGLSNLKVKITWKTPEDSFYSGFKINPYFDRAGTQDNPATLSGNNPTLFACPSTDNGAGNIADPEYRPAADQVPNVQALACTLTITAPRLILGVLTMPDTSITPSISSYEYMKYQTQTEMGKLISAGRGTKPIQSQNYNLSQVPHAVLLAVVPQKNGKVFELLGGKTDLPVNSLPDIYFTITGVNIKLGNRSGILSNAPSATLFEMNRQNGLAFCNYPNSGMAVVSTTNNNTVNPGVMFQLNTFTETVGTTPSSFLCLPGQGCPLLLRFGKDIPLDDASLSAGVACNTNITFNLQVNSPYLTGNSTAELVVIFLYDGVFTISASAGSSFNVGLLSREDVIASDKNRIDFGELQGAPGSGGMLGGVMVGGSFLSKLKKMGRSSWNVIKNPKVQNYLRKGLNLAADLDIPGASAVNTAINTLEGNGMYRKGGMLGGNVLSATEIRRRLYQ